MTARPTCVHQLLADSSSHSRHGLQAMHWLAILMISTAPASRKQGLTCHAQVMQHVPAIHSGNGGAVTRKPLSYPPALLPLFLRCSSSASSPDAMLSSSEPASCCSSASASAAAMSELVARAAKLVLLAGWLLLLMLPVCCRLLLCWDPSDSLRAVPRDLKASMRLHCILGSKVVAMKAHTPSIFTEASHGRMSGSHSAGCVA